jgi:hypothetical protein
LEDVADGSRYAVIATFPTGPRPPPGWIEWRVGLKRDKRVWSV